MCAYVILCDMEQFDTHARHIMSYHSLDGGWIVKKVVGGRPAILGQKITQYYYKNEELNYIEVHISHIQITFQHANELTFLLVLPIAMMHDVMG